MTSALYNIALSQGGFRYSLETKFLHLNHKKNIKDNQTIPVLENLTYSLSLLRSKDIKNIERALVILEGCLRFKTEEGAFPRYIHEYPMLHLYRENVNILNALYWIEKEFKKNIPKDFLKEIEGDIAGLLVFLEDNKCSLRQSSLFRFEILKSVILGNTVEIEKLYKEEFLYSKEGMADVFLSLQLYDLENKKQITRDIWEKGLTLYNMELASYIGPIDNLFQDRCKTELTLSDLFILSLSKKIDSMDSDNPVLLLSSLIKPIINIEQSTPLDLVTRVYEKDGSSWISYGNGRYNYTSIDKMGPTEKRFFGFHLFRTIFGVIDDMGSLVCQHFDGDYKFKMDGDTAILDFHLPNKNTEDLIEIKFFVENDNTDITVNRVKATLFNMDDKIYIERGGVVLSLSFESLSTGDKFCGHIFRGNRASQLSYRKDKTKAYDYVIGLRTIARLDTKNSRVRVKINASFI